MSPRRPLLAALLIAALATTASPAVAMTPKTMTPKTVTPGWNPSDRPANVNALAEALAEVTYAMSCGTVTATGWSADVADDTEVDVAALLVTTSAVTGECADLPGGLVVRQGGTTLDARRWIHDPATGLGSVVSAEDRPYVDWDYVPMPRPRQWVGISARAGDGAVLDLIERRVTFVDADTFTLDAPVDASYLGAPVVDNTGRVLGTITAAGTIVTGSPRLCDIVFICTDPSQVWRDITAPSAVTDIQKMPGKGRVTFTWKAATDDGGAEVAYWYRIGAGQWTKTDTFRVTVKARKGQRVTIALGTVNDAGPGPTVIVSAKAR